MGYRAVEEIHDDGTPTTKTFEHVASEIGAEEAEEVGVEHLLRDIKDTTVGTLSQQITNQLLIMYAGSLIRSIIALHNLINNKITNKEAEKKETTTKKTAVKAAAAGGKDE